MTAPQVVYFVVMALNLICTAILHGLDKKEGIKKHNFFYTLFTWVISMAFWYWAGFFDNLINITLK